MYGNQAPIIVLQMNTKREQGRTAQLSNIKAGKAVSDIIRTTLGPKAMLKMLMDPMGGIVMTNDGNAILREIDVMHPGAKSMIELSRAQDEEVGDGTTSVIILAGEMLAVSEPFLTKEIHPTVIVNAYYKALEDCMTFAEEIAMPVDINKDEEVSNLIRCCLGTKFASKWGNLISDLAHKAVKTVYNKTERGFDCDIKKFAKVEKIPGGSLSDCVVLDGVMFNKDLVHPQMRKKIKNPRVILLDCPLEYKKGESMLNVEMTNENDFNSILEQERKEVKTLCDNILRFKPDVVVTEKGVSELAAHYLLKGNVSCIRRLRKTDVNRIAKVSGAVVVNRPEELQESDVGLRCGDFEIKKIGDEFFAFFTECQDPKACSIILRGATKDVLNEMERNLQDALCVGRNIYANPKLIPGGGAFEMEVSARLTEKSKSIEGLLQYPYLAVANALEVIPRTLAQNCGGEVVRVITELRAKHSNTSDAERIFYGVNGITGKVENMKELNVWDTLSVKKQTLKTAVESACMILRIDDIVSGGKKREKKEINPSQEAQIDNETFGDARDG